MDKNEFAEQLAKLKPALEAQVTEGLTIHHKATGALELLVHILNQLEGDGDSDSEVDA